MRVLVTGGRGYADKELVYKVLDSWNEDQGISILIHGAAKGADSLAGQWARDRGIQEVVCPANWNYHGLKAGPIRNRAMLNYLSPDIVVAFPGSSGTSHMVEIATKKGVQIYHAIDHRR